MFCIQ